MLLVLIIVLLSLAGCTAISHLSTLQRDDIGTAVRCYWSNGVPSHCVEDPTRVTIDRDYLEEIIDALHQCRDAEFDRRKL